MINWQQNFMSSYSAIKQIGRTPTTRRPILLITRMITDRIGLHSPITIIYQPSYKTVKKMV